MRRLSVLAFPFLFPPFDELLGMGALGILAICSHERGKGQEKRLDDQIDESDNLFA